MYRHILSLLYEFFGDKAEMVLAAGLAALATAVLLLLSKSWRRGVAEAQDRGGWRAVVMGLVNIPTVNRAVSIYGYSVVTATHTRTFSLRHIIPRFR